MGNPPVTAKIFNVSDSIVAYLHGGVKGVGDKILGVRIFGEGETRFLERKLCKELYTVVAGLYGLYGGEGIF